MYLIIVMRFLGLSCLLVFLILCDLNYFLKLIIMLVLIWLRTAISVTYSCSTKMKVAIVITEMYNYKRLFSQRQVVFAV